MLSYVHAGLAFTGILEPETCVPVFVFQYFNAFTKIPMENWNIGTQFGIMEYKNLFWNTGITKNFIKEIYLFY